MLVELPGNQSANLRSYSDLSERDARQIRAAYRDAIAMLAGVEEAEEDIAKSLAAVKATEENGSTPLERYQDLCIVKAVTAWSLGSDLPTTDTIGDLPSGTYAKLAEKATEAMRQPDFGPDPDPKAPTGDSSDSELTSPAEA